MGVAGGSRKVEEHLLLFAFLLGGEGREDHSFPFVFCCFFCGRVGGVAIIC